MADIVYNTDGEYGKYIMQELKTPAFPPKFVEFYKTYANRLLYVDSNNIPGAFQMNTSWYMHASDVRPLYAHGEHVHDFDEMVGFLGSDPENPYDLGGEIEIGIGGELHRLTKSSIIFMPAGIKHLPLSIIELHRPILHFSVSMNPFYYAKRAAEGEETTASGATE
jgi:hypothetical protein